MINCFRQLFKFFKICTGFISKLESFRDTDKRDTHLNIYTSDTDIALSWWFFCAKHLFINTAAGLFDRVTALKFSRQTDKHNGGHSDLLRNWHTFVPTEKLPDGLKTNQHTHRPCELLTNLPIYKLTDSLTYLKTCRHSDLLTNWQTVWLTVSLSVSLTVCQTDRQKSNLEILEPSWAKSFNLTKAGAEPSQKLKSLKSLSRADPSRL